jgi:hypothetical protein
MCHAVPDTDRPVSGNMPTGSRKWPTRFSPTSPPTFTSTCIRIAIEAFHSDGFDDGQIRTVSENATQLRFDESGFEAE